MLVFAVTGEVRSADLFPDSQELLRQRDRERTQRGIMERSPDVRLENAVQDTGGMLLPTDESPCCIYFKIHGKPPKHLDNRR